MGFMSYNPTTLWEDTTEAAVDVWDSTVGVDGLAGVVNGDVSLEQWGQNAYDSLDNTALGVGLALGTGPVGAITALGMNTAFDDNPLLGQVYEHLNMATEKARELDERAGNIIRGGTQLQLQRRYTDYERIDKFLRSSTGQTWLTQQVGLQLSNPRVDAPMMGALDNLLGGGFGVGLGDHPPDPNQTEYLPTVNINKTLLSVGLAGMINTGPLAAREGLIPFVHSGYYDNFFSKGKATDEGMRNPEHNKLVYLGTNIGHIKREQEDANLLGQGLGKLNNIASKINDVLNWLGGGGE